MSSAARTAEARPESPMPCVDLTRHCYSNPTPRLFSECYSPSAGRSCLHCLPRSINEYISPFLLCPFCLFPRSLLHIYLVYRILLLLWCCLGPFPPFSGRLLSFLPAPRYPYATQVVVECDNAMMLPDVPTFPASSA